MCHRKPEDVEAWESSNRDVLSLGHFVATNSSQVDELVQFVGITASDTVLDIGSGDGSLLFDLHRRTGCHGLGVEVNPELHRLAEQRRAQEESWSVTFRCCPAE